MSSEKMKLKVFYGRKTFVQRIELPLAFDFVELHHKQGLSAPGKRVIAYGLFSGTELLGVAIFCNPRTSGMQRKYSTELFRLAFQKDIRVIGGASKLIKFFIADKSPANIFTYQDTSGETTGVYEKAGMCLVSAMSPKTKTILVKNGLNFKTAANNRRDWFSIEQAVRFGPDSLLGTSLGEVFREDTGERVSNVDLFTEYCDYHKEEVPGDRVYEWLNKNVAFYTYKITSTKDDGYYYGRKTIWKNNPSKQDCLNDGYYGSGGAKFQRWVNQVGEDNLIKEIISVHQSWEKTIKEETALISGLYKEDPDCQNAIAGGTGYAAHFPYPIMKKCDRHGETQHRGTSCFKCALEKTLSVKECHHHGSTAHMGDSCLKCASLQSIYYDECIEHGRTKHQGSACITCSIRKTYSVGICAIHGETKFRKSVCCKCEANKNKTVDICELHGETKFVNDHCAKCNFYERGTFQYCDAHDDTMFFRGGRCLSCSFKNNFQLKECTVHGITYHNKTSCVKCTMLKVYSLRECYVHGQTIHAGDSCRKCSAEGSFETKECDIHGPVLFKGKSCCACTSKSSVRKGHCEAHGNQVTFVGNKCRHCVNMSATNMRECAQHGMSKHQGNSCTQCSSEKRLSVKNCTLHGQTIHAGNSCRKCSVAKQFTQEDCRVHGMVTHQGGKCLQCITGKQFSEKECAIHGKVKFKGNSCCKCTAEKTAHKRFHQKKIKDGCPHCHPELITAQSS